MAASYQNFRSPIRLAAKMAFGSSSIGRWALTQTVASLALKPFERFFVERENRLIRNSSYANDLPVILVVGGPRTGTTFASQLLARYLEVSFFTNATELSPDTPIWATRTISDPFAPAAKFDSNSFYGNTAGLRGINDGFTIWNQWLGDDRYQAFPIDDKAEAMRRFFANWSSVFGKPLLNKNNRNLDAMQWLARELPNSVFVIVRRDPFDVARSLLAAREYIQGDKNYRWGLLSNDAAPSEDPLGYVDRVAEQIQNIDRRIAEQLPNIDAKRWMDVNYTDYCDSPQEFVRAVGKLAGGVAVREDRISRELTAPISFRSLREISEVERARLETVFSENQIGTLKTTTN